MEIHLPDFVIAKLYENNLTLVSSQVPSKDTKNITTAANPQLQWLGDNKQNITIVVDDPTVNTFIKEEELKKLTEILSACKLNIDDVAIINIAKTPADFEQIIETAKSRYLLLFGVSAEKISLPQPMNLFESKTIKNIPCLNSSSLESMLPSTDEAKAMKLKFWNKLRIMFRIKGK